MSSDSEPVVAVQSEKQRLKDRRREALARLKDASQSRKSRPQPRFLGAEGDDDDSDGADEPVDFDRWDRQSAERRQKQQRSGGGGGDISSSTRPQRRSPSPLRDPTLSRAFDDLFDLGADGQAATNEDGTPKVDDDLDLDDAPAKKRRIVAKMDEERLLGPSGFPLLREHMKKLKIKGKGHERQDLKRVLTMYQLWSHQMYPKTNLRDTLVTVEKLCHKRTVQRALKQYRDEERQGLRKDDERDENDAFAGLPLSGDQRNGTEPADRPDAQKAAPTREELLRDAGFDFDDLDGEDDLFADEEALLAEMEAEQHRSKQPKPPPARPASGDAAAAPRAANQPAVGQDVEMQDEDDEAEAALREAEALLGF